jgi:hypothetical protein
MSTKTTNLINAAKAALTELEASMPHAKTIEDLRSAIHAAEFSNYKDAVRTARSRGHRGVWVAFAKLDTLRRLLIGEIDEATARSITLAP